MSRPWIVVSLAIVFLLTLSSGVLAVARNTAPSTERGPALAVTEQVQHPKIQHKVDPEYPKEAKEKRIQGTVELRITISDKGEVSVVKVVQGHELLREAAVSAVKQWRFSPALKEGQPVTVEATVTFEFRLD